jgi:CRP-like cAMP-binding protein
LNHERLGGDLDTHNSLQIEDIKPGLVPETEIINFSESVKFLKHSQNKNYLKLSPEEFTLVEKFKGTQSFSEILQDELEEKGAQDFRIIFDLMIKLNAGDFLSGDYAEEIKDEIEILESDSKLTHAKNKILQLLRFDILQLKNTFSNPLLQNISSTIFSLPFILLLFLTAIVYTPMRNVVYLHSFQLKTIIGQSDYTSFAIVELISIWLILSLSISLKNILSAYKLSHYKLDVINPRITFSWGLLYFTIDSDDIVKRGLLKSISFYCSRIFFPLTLIIACFGWDLIPIEFSLLTLFFQLSLFISFINISPLFSSELNQILRLMRPEGGNPANSFAYLSQSFIKEIFSLNKKYQGQNYNLLTSSYSIIWIYLFYAYLWDNLKLNLLAFFTRLSELSLTDKVLISVYIFSLVIPSAILLLTTLIIAIQNLKSVARTPIYKLSKISQDIFSKKIPAHESIYNFIHEIPLFSKLSESHTKALCEVLRVIEVPVGRNIIVEGDIGSEFFTIVKGKVKVTKRLETGAKRDLATLEIGDSFGEVALIEDTYRTATVKAITKTFLIKLEQADFNEFIKNSGINKEDITDMIGISKLLMNIEMFSCLNSSQINSLISKLQSAQFDEGETIFHQGDPGDNFYIIDEGGVLIRRMEEDKISLEKTLTQGDYFGEIALIKRVDRTASAIATTQTQTLYLMKQDFYDVIKGNLLAGIKLNELAGERLNSLGKEFIDHVK